MYFLWLNLVFQASQELCLFLLSFGILIPMQKSCDLILEFYASTTKSQEQQPLIFSMQETLPCPIWDIWMSIQNGASSEGTIFWQTVTHMQPLLVIITMLCFMMIQQGIIEPCINSTASVPRIHPKCIPPTTAWEALKGFLYKAIIQVLLLNGLFLKIEKKLSNELIFNFL